MHMYTQNFESDSFCFASLFLLGGGGRGKQRKLRKISLVVNYKYKMGNQRKSAPLT